MQWIFFIKKIENIKISTALDILEKIFLALSESGEYLILPERITLNEQTVFYNEIKKDVKIAYIPLPDSKSSPKNNLLIFVSELKEKTPEKMKDYFDTIKTNIDKNNYYVNELADITSLMKRELYACGIE